MAVVVLSGVVQVDIADESFTLGAGNGQVFAEEGPRPDTNAEVKINIWLLRLKQVQEELKLDDQQTATINEENNKVNTFRRDQVSAARQLQGEERRKKYAAIKQAVAEMNSEVDKKLRQILRPDQKLRLEQISIQQRGIRALSEEAVAIRLKLDESQQQRIAAGITKWQEERDQLTRAVRSGNFDRTQQRDAYQKLHAELQQTLMDVLREEQKAEFERMKGAEFKLIGA